jgi:hypothetical protein
MCEGAGAEVADGLKQAEEGMIRRGAPNSCGRALGSGVALLSADDKMTHEDAGLETLLLLNGEIYDQGNGYWIKIEAWRVEPNKHIPHGVRYALTLHDRRGTRLLGFDNAHAVKPPKHRRFAGRRLAYDHRHRHARDRGMPYEFTSPDQLLKDFFDEVDRVLKELQQ